MTKFAVDDVGTIARRMREIEAAEREGKEAFPKPKFIDLPPCHPHSGHWVQDDPSKYPYCSVCGNGPKKRDPRYDPANPDNYYTGVNTEPRPRATPPEDLSGLRWLISHPQIEGEPSAVTAEREQIARVIARYNEYVEHVLRHGAEPRRVAADRQPPAYPADES